MPQEFPAAARTQSRCGLDWITKGGGPIRVSREAAKPQTKSEPNPCPSAAPRLAFLCALCDLCGDFRAEMNHRGLREHRGGGGWNPDIPKVLAPRIHTVATTHRSALDPCLSLRITKCGGSRKVAGQSGSRAKPRSHKRNQNQTRAPPPRLASPFSVLSVTSVVTPKKPAGRTPALPGARDAIATPAVPAHRRGVTRTSTRIPA